MQTLADCEFVQLLGACNHSALWDIYKWSIGTVHFKFTHAPSVLDLKIFQIGKLMIVSGMICSKVRPSVKCMAEMKYTLVVESCNLF